VEGSNFAKRQDQNTRNSFQWKTPQLDLRTEVSPLAQMVLKPNKLHNLFADLRHLATAGEYKHQMVAFTANHQRSKAGGCV